MTRGLLALSLEPVELRAVIERALEQTSSVVAQKKHTLSLDMPVGPLVVRGDKTRLIQIFANLVNNAAKYTPPGGRIGVSVRTGDGQASVSVEDDGEGFSQELLPRICDLFSQAERTPDRSQGGLGLGLALVLSLVRLHGGSVTAFSRPVSTTMSRSRSIRKPSSVCSGKRCGKPERRAICYHVGIRISH